MSTLSAAPVSLHSIAFAYPASRDALLLRDHATDQLVGATPEWTATGHRAPAAYSGGARPTIRVVLARAGPPAHDGASFGDDPPTGPWLLGATGIEGPGVAEREIELRFDGAGLTSPIELTLASPLPSALGLLRLQWEWRITGPGGPFDVGASAHDVLLTRRPILDPADWLGPNSERADAAGHPWTYQRIMEWTCTWAAGLDDDKAIVDAIFEQLPSSGLKYGVQAEDVRDMLHVGGGMCGKWSRLFQAMAGSQGVQVQRRCFHVDWRDLPDGEVKWCALVVRNPGINQTVPVTESSEFHDVQSSDFVDYLRTEAVEGVPPDFMARVVTERRYRFWGIKGMDHDGHCIALLEYRGSVYLYDPSFMMRVSLDCPGVPPVPNTLAPVDITAPEFGNFKGAYLDHAVDFMLGSMPALGGGFIKPDNGALLGDAARNGLTVKTSGIPRKPGELTFYWIL